MTAEEEKALLREYFAACERLNSSFGFSVGLVGAWLPMTADRIDRLDIEADTSLVAFLKRFEQFEDALHRTLKAISKIMEYGRIERLTPVDVTRRAHKLGILDSAETWANAVRARNALAHEYPLDPQKRADQVNTAWAARTTLTETWQSIQTFVSKEGLL